MNGTESLASKSAVARKGNVAMVWAMVETAIGS